MMTVRYAPISAELNRQLAELSTQYGLVPISIYIEAWILGRRASRSGARAVVAFTITSRNGHQ